MNATIAIGHATKEDIDLHSLSSTFRSRSRHFDRSCTKMTTQNMASGAKTFVAHVTANTGLQAKIIKSAKHCWKQVIILQLTITYLWNNCHFFIFLHFGLPSVSGNAVPTGTLYLLRVILTKVSIYRKPWLRPCCIPATIANFPPAEIGTEPWLLGAN